MRAKAKLSARVLHKILCWQCGATNWQQTGEELHASLKIMAGEKAVSNAVIDGMRSQANR